MKAQLPDVYVSRQARAFLEALQEGDTDKARRIEEELLAEAASGPEDREALRDELRGAILFRAHVDASAAGDTETAALFRHLFTEMCSERVVKATLAAALLTSGLKMGQLLAKDHDFLTRHMDENGVGEEFRALATRIKRVP
ncbi:hypothetical protein [Streptomyces rubradiris]|uniref:Uncharacterized protein n=1 Tax=Streptomyces rubradiris TaxID=285531 RepID=A0ABQ3RAE3_STRRR|nr:hypothetical protein [Streptomyces rubradiris]GHH25853.1 hypothetical protein GCM10018792_65520 [Streptomyces rubradiris]GHI52757.1 hypothetical protein Srubr_26030 [Streptomyces rubradiris]